MADDHNPRKHKHKHKHDKDASDQHPNGGPELGLTDAGAEQQVEVKHKHKSKKRRSDEVDGDIPDIPDAPDVSGDVHDVGVERGKKKKKKKMRKGEGEDGSAVEVVNGAEEAVEREAVVGHRVSRQGVDADAASSSGRFSISMAVAGSIVDNAQSFALASRVCVCGFKEVLVL